MLQVNKKVDFKINHFFQDEDNDDFSVIYLFFLFTSLIFSVVISSAILQFMPDFIQDFLNRLMTSYENSVVFSQDSSLMISVLQFLSIVVLAPIMEEFFYRGFLINRLSIKLNLRWAVFISTLLFTIGHGDIISSFIKGYVFSIIYVKTKSLKIPIIFHVANNLFAFTLFKTFDLSQVENLKIPDFAAIIIFLLLIISFPLLIHFFYMYRVKDEKISPFEKIFKGDDIDVQDE
jgi:membrane protease YdiL (CAAX protease family)